MVSTKYKVFNDTQVAKAIQTVAAKAFRITTFISNMRLLDGF